MSKRDPLLEELDSAKEWHPEESLPFVLAVCTALLLAAIAAAYAAFRAFGV